MFTKILFIFLIFALSGKVFANAAQPGIWYAGGMGNFSLLFPDDSISYKKIQMTDEKVSILFYKGYAVVKGEYKMFNDTKDTIKIRTGYPLNTSFKSKTNDVHRAEIMFDSLYSLKVLVNSNPVKLISIPSDGREGSSGNENWYVWNNTFAPGDTTVITVYFIVNTNGSIIRKGYTKDENNGFIYILETGSTWKQPIIKGEIRIKLEDDIKTDDIKGIRPDSVFRTDEKNGILQYKFSNISPTSLDNVIITYTEKIRDQDFSGILSNKDKLYKKADDFSEAVINGESLSGKKFNSPFEVNSTDWGSLLFILSFVGIPLLILFVIISVIIFIVIRIYKKNKKKKSL